MSHKSFIVDQIVALLEPRSRTSEQWHTEDELEEFLVRQGFDRDAVQDAIDTLIDDGVLDFSVDRSCGCYLIGPAAVHSGYGAS